MFSRLPQCDSDLVSFAQEVDGVFGFEDLGDGEGVVQGQIAVCVALGLEGGREAPGHKPIKGRTGALVNTN